MCIHVWDHVPLFEPNFQKVRILFLINKEGIEDIRSNKKSCCRYSSVQRLNKENVGLLLNVAGDLGTADTTGTSSPGQVDNLNSKNVVGQSGSEYSG